MSEYVKNIGQYSRYDELCEYVYKLLDEYPDLKNGGFICLQGYTSDASLSTCKPVPLGGDLDSNDKKMTAVLDKFTGTVIEDFLKQYNIKTGKLSIFGKQRNFLYPHCDYANRIHVPISTHEDSKFYWIQSNQEFDVYKDFIKNKTPDSLENLDYTVIAEDHLPADSNVYMLNTKNLHYFEHKSDTPRIHIYGDTYDSF